MRETGVLSHTFGWSWKDLSAAFFMRYPNMNSKHVLSLDTLACHVDMETGCLHTTRLLKKTNSKPKWMERWVGDSQVYILEQTVVDPKRQVLSTVLRNITLQTYMEVIETSVYTADNSSTTPSTLVETTARVTSSLMIARMVESYGSKRFAKNVCKARAGLESVLEQLDCTPSQFRSSPLRRRLYANATMCEEAESETAHA